MPGFVKFKKNKIFHRVLTNEVEELKEDFEPIKVTKDEEERFC